MKKYNKCLRCGRKLKSEESKERGMGNICWDRYQNSTKYKELFALGNIVNTDMDNSSVANMSNNVYK